MNDNIITKTKAGKIAGVSKQAISKAEKTGTYNMFVEVPNKSGNGSKTMVDTSSAGWTEYLTEREYKKSKNNKIVSKSIKNNSSTKKKIESNQKVDKKKSVKKKSLKSSIEKQKKDKFENENEYEEEKLVHALTGSVNPNSCELRTTADVKRLTEITKMNLEMRIKLNEYIKREIMDYYLDLIAHNISAVFVNLGRSVSEDICEQLERVGMEKVVEEIISKPVARGIEDIQKACDDGKKLRAMK